MQSRGRPAQILKGRPHRGQVVLRLLRQCQGTVLADEQLDTELILQAPADPQGNYPKPGYTWTAMGPANAIPAVCEAPPGFITHFELGLMPLRGVVR